MNTWILALKEYNTGKKYSLPKKGSKEYLEVKKIQMKLSAPKAEFDDNVKLYKRTKKNLKDANNTYEATKPLQNQTIQNLKKANSLVGKISGGSLRKALDLASRNPEDFVKLVNQQQTGAGLKQVGGFLPAFIIPFIPAITSALTTAAGAFATGAIGAAGAYAVDELVGEGMQYDKKQTALLKAVEGERKSAKPNKARDARVMRKYKKNLKSMSGSGIAEIVLDNPEESFNLGKLIFGSQNAPTVKNGKVVLPPTPLENLWNSIF